jgi:hypothetical protein
VILLSLARWRRRFAVTFSIVMAREDRGEDVRYLPPRGARRGVVIALIPRNAHARPFCYARNQAPLDTQSSTSPSRRTRSSGSTT